jgi:hypothetical protein
MKDAFGIVAMVAMAPLIVIQIMGLVYKIKTSDKGAGAARASLTQEEAGEIVIYEGTDYE